MSHKTLTKADLVHFTGSERWFFHSVIGSVLYTEGAKYVAEQGGAYWLLDEIAFNQILPKLAHEAFQLWKLSVQDDDSATLLCEDGNGNALFSKHIAYTDFPMPEISFYFVNDTILLPSEY